MRIFDGKTWRDGYLDPHRESGQLRVRPTRWAVLAELDDVHIVPERSVRRVLDYAREMGPVRLARKVASRWGERDRNQLVAATGIGEVVEADDESMVGTYVVFFAPAAPPAAERIVLDELFCAPTSPRTGALQLVEAVGHGVGRDLYGWSPQSGQDPGATQEILKQCEALLSTAITREVFDFATTPVQEVAPQSPGPSTRAVTIFGWGHHARTQLVPSLPDDWAIDRIHEIDPRLHDEVETTWDTSPYFRERETPDIACLAGYHHTHGPLAAEALRRGATVVVEKPVVTTREQLDALEAAWVEPSRLFSLYHRRYGRIAEALREDLSGPVDMHTTVFEIPLPAHHWYRWPNSGGRIVGNGCHWIDQFLWLNPNAQVVDAQARRGPRGQVVAELTLSNNAFFTMTMTDRGSDRRGTREFTEFRTDERTARVVDAIEYVCEDRQTEVRRLNAPPLDALETAYAAVFRAIESGEAGESWRSVYRTHDAMLRLAQSSTSSGAS